MNTMKDNNYVILSLEKYNEVYGKAKKYDEVITCHEEREQEIDNKYNVECVRTFVNIPIGARGIDLEPDSSCPYIEWDNHYDCTYPTEIKGVTYENVFAISRENLKKTI